ncbi:MAG TPA: hypothetical protein VGB70_12925 [Allosphingosinicella sp.]|jgi:hypothetical protein
MSTAPLPENNLAMRSALVKRAMHLVGAQVYAERMGVSDRTARYWATEGGDRNRPVTDRILRDTLKLLVEHRQHVGRLGQGIRAALGEQGERE